MLESADYSIEQLAEIVQGDRPLRLAQRDIERIKACAEYLASIVDGDSPSVYGVNTGFGSLCNISIPADEITQLQYNLLRSHACGVGNEVPSEIVRYMLLLKIISLKQGYSGVRWATVERLMALFNKNTLPQIFELGSLGASGDLAPLAHLALPLIGEGRVRMDGALKSASELDMEPLKLGPKEGLALINGTQFSTAYAAWSIHKAKKLMNTALKIAALSMDAFGCRRTPLDPKVHAIRNQLGQQEVARQILALLGDSGMEKIAGSSVQDPYSFRCIPQVLGATHDVLGFVTQIVEREVNAVTDNPNVFYEEEEILEGGNFHAQPIALACDQLAIAMAEVGSIAERRTFLMVSGFRDLPVYLTKSPGVQSGMMIVQYTAASVASQNKQLCTPASVDSIVSSKGQEDHVSMAANAATKLRQVLLNVERILAMELLVTAQAIDFRRPLKSSPELEAFHAAFRERVEFASEDRIFSEDIEAAVKFIAG